MFMPLLMMLAGAAQVEPAAVPIALPTWMAGCWITQPNADGQRSEECWTVPRGTMMLGSGHNFDAGRTVTFEHMRIEQADGSLVFVALPGGQNSTRFMLQATRVGDDLRDGLSFVNLDNGYPQRILYWRDGEELLAEIAFIDGRERVRWRFRRA